jgi:transposase, IS30 family
MKNTQVSKDKNTFMHIKKAERSEIALLISKGYSYHDIAQALGRSVSSISDEIKRNSVRGKYDPKKADHKSYVKRKYAKYESMKIVACDTLKSYVTEKLNEDWSPEIISGRMKFVDTHIPYASHRVIYKYIDSPYGRKLENKLARKYRKKARKRVKVTKLKDRVFIDKRPNIIDERLRFGDWEGDFIVSGRDGQGVLLVLYERKSRYVIIQRLLKTDHETVNSYLQSMTGGLIIMQSLTLDNDIAFRKHTELSKTLGVPIYFCHPYHSWEKGGVENVNGLIRRYITKGSDISKYSDEFIKNIEDKLNDRPRKCLKFKTPREIMNENFQFKIENIRVRYNNKNNPVFGLGV